MLNIRQIYKTVMTLKGNLVKKIKKSEKNSLQRF